MSSENKGKSFVWKDGTFVEGKASPELLPEHMRGLPSDWVTKEEADGDKIHELDPPHIVKSLIYEQTKKLNEAKKDIPAAVEELAKSIAPLGAVVPLNQTRIDLVRFRIIRTRVNRLASSKTPDVDLANVRVDYVFFPEDNVNKYELRAKSALPHPLPKHLRNFKLEIDIYNWPQSIIEALEAIGHKPPDIKEMISAAKRRTSIAEELQREESLLWTPGQDH